MNNAVYKVGFFVLLAINIALVVFLTVRPKPGSGPKRRQDEMAQELNLTPEQKEQFAALALGHRESITALNGQGKELMRTFFSSVSSEDITDRQKDVLLRDILGLEEEKILVTYHHFEDLRNICTEEQKAHFGEVMLRIIPLLINDDHKPERGRRPPR